MSASLVAVETACAQVSAEAPGSGRDSVLSRSTSDSAVSPWLRAPGLGGGVRQEQTRRQGFLHQQFIWEVTPRTWTEEGEGGGEGEEAHVGCVLAPVPVRAAERSPAGEQ